MPDKIRVTISTLQLEIPVVWRQPGVQDLRDRDPTPTNNQHARRLLAAMARVTFDPDADEPLFSHLLQRTMLTRPPERPA